MVDALDDLSHQLWTLRELLDQLVYKLEVQQLLLGAGRSRWLPYVGAELDALLTAIDDVDRARARASRAVTDRVGLPVDASLGELAVAVGEPMGQVLRSHRIHLQSLHDQVADVSRSNHELARRGLASTRDLLAALGDDVVDLYDPVGGPSQLSLSSQRLDRTV